MADLVITVSCIVLLFIYQTHFSAFYNRDITYVWSFVIIPRNELRQLNSRYQNRFSKLSILTRTHLGLLWGGGVFLSHCRDLSRASSNFENTSQLRDFYQQTFPLIFIRMTQISFLQLHCMSNAPVCCPINFMHQTLHGRQRKQYLLYMMWFMYY